MDTENYKNVIIGSGEAGKLLAWHLGQSGQQVAVVERRWIGGSCPNINCLPSKNEIWSAKVANLVYHAGRFGSTVTTGPVNMAVVRQRKREMVDAEVQFHLDRYKATGVELLLGEAQFTGANTIEVRLNDGGTRTLKGERIFLNLGTHASIPPVRGLAERAPLTHIEALELDHLPEHLIVMGGGYVGLEFAQAYRRFGSQVTVIQNTPQFLANADHDVSAEIIDAFKSEGIDCIAPTEIMSVSGHSGEQVRVAISAPSGERTITGSHILVATGRTPNTRGIGLELAKVELDPRGYIKVNDRLETTVRNIWAMGECAGSPQFTHVSHDDFRVIRDNLAGGNRSTRGRLVPSCLFTDPQVAQIGLTEKEANQHGIAFRLARIPMQAVLRTHTTGENRGFMKALIDVRSDRILGFTMVGPEAGEVLAAVQTAMLAGLPYTALREAILAHPTMAEGLNVLFSEVEPASETAKGAGAGRSARAS
jgi:pyruvate/2-oxoglutarate dehydrogenase complex dihydrolipoamide dehydrogenase (E3) component